MCQHLASANVVVAPMAISPLRALRLVINDSNDDLDTLETNADMSVSTLIFAHAVTLAAIRIRFF